jgi:protein SCO1/2
MAGLTRRLAVAASAVVAATVAGMAGCDASRPQFRSIDITGADYAQQLALPDAASGRMRTLADWRGKVVVVFFGYTQCPDVCPSTLAELATVKRGLGADSERVQPVFVSIDPERDTPEILRAYVGSFGPDFVALRGDADQTQAAAKAFKVYYAKAAGADGAAYTMDHTAGEYVFDPKGRIRLFSRYGSGPDALLHDIRLLLDEAG